MMEWSAYGNLCASLSVLSPTAIDKPCSGFIGFSFVQPMESDPDHAPIECS